METQIESACQKQAFAPELGIAIKCDIIMNQRAKLFSAILNSPRDVRFADACKVAEALGFVGRQKGSHRFYALPGEASVLNFQDRNGRIVHYQALQLIEMIRKYGGSNGY